MAGKGKSTSVPKEWESYYRDITALTDEFCQEHLNNEYADLARRAIAALCRKRPSPLLAGKPRTWACGVLYALGQINFLSDKATDPYLAMRDLCRHFGVAPSTGGNKAKEVRDALHIRAYDHRWMMPSVVETCELAWMITVDGLLVDARNMSLAVQEEAFGKGFIPYIPAYATLPAPGQPTRGDILDRYDRCRLRHTEHQTAAAADIMREPAQIAAVAVRLGLAASTETAARLDIDDLVPALDTALYTPDQEGRLPIERYVESRLNEVGDDERLVLQAMVRSRFCVLELTNRHSQAGFMARDLVTGDDLWLMDRALEQTGYRLLRLATRLIQPADFWITTGVAVPLNDTRIWKVLERAYGIRRGDDRKIVVPDLEHLDEIMYTVAIATPE